MKVNRRIKKIELQRQKKIKQRNSDRILIGVGMGLVMMVILFYGFLFLNNQMDKNAYKKFIGREVPINSVCMKGDIVKGYHTDEVEINGKIYGACSQKCKNGLLHNRHNFRYAVDPVTRKIVDKSSSYIVLKPNGRGKVLYFESKENYLQYNSINQSN